MAAIKYKINSEVVFRQEEEDALLFHPGTGQVKILNETGTLIYRCIESGLSREKTIDSIMKLFDNENRQDVEVDFEEFITQMEHAGILLLVE